MSVTNHKSAPLTCFWVAIGRVTRWPSGRRVVSIAVSIFSTRPYRSAIFFVVGTGSGRSRSAVGFVMRHSAERENGSDRSSKAGAVPPSVEHRHRLAHFVRVAFRLHLPEDMGDAAVLADDEGAALDSHELPAIHRL